VRIKRFTLVFAAAAALALPSGALAAGGPTTGPVPDQPGNSCFGNWRAGSVQQINELNTATGDNAGSLYFSQRKGDNAQLNADAKALCQS
jgi:ABC-type sugar transport system substrate-binding protein